MEGADDESAGSLYIGDEVHSSNNAEQGGASEKTQETVMDASAIDSAIADANAAVYEASAVADDDSIDSGCPPPPPTREPPAHLLGKADENEEEESEADFYPPPLTYEPSEQSGEKDEAADVETGAIDDGEKEMDETTDTNEIGEDTDSNDEIKTNEVDENTEEEIDDLEAALPPKADETPKDSDTIDNSVEQTEGDSDIGGGSVSSSEKPAEPVPKSVSGASEQTPERDTKPARLCTKRRGIIIVFILLLLIVALVLGIGYGTGAFSNDSKSSSVSKAIDVVTSSPTLSPVAEEETTPLPTASPRVTVSPTSSPTTSSSTTSATSDPTLPPTNTPTSSPTKPACPTACVNSQSSWETKCSYTSSLLNCTLCPECSQIDGSPTASPIVEAEEEDEPTGAPVVEDTTYSASDVTREEAFDEYARTTLLSPTSDESVFDDPNSAESMSLNFMINDDVAQLDPTDTSEENQARIKQRYGLLTIWFTSYDTRWINVENWLSEDECTWYGVTCSDENAVSGLDLSQNNLAERGLPKDALYNLPNLIVLNLAFNNMSGSLQELGCQDGNVNTNLEFLNLRNNNFGGYVTNITSCYPNIVEIDVSNNYRVFGPIPNDIGEKVPNLAIFRANTANIRGSLPDSITTLTNLQILDVRRSRMQGQIPANIGSLTALEVLRIDENFIAGNIPDSIGDSLNLRVLTMENNYLTGAIPPSITNLVNLETLIIRDLYITGVLPTNIGNMKNLTTLSIDTTYYPEDGYEGISGPIPESIGDLSNLETLELFTNGLTGQIPSRIGNLKNLQRLDLHSNWLDGPIPEELGNATSLWYADLEDNQLTGPIPESLGQLSNLRRIYLTANNIEGSMPEEVCLLRQEGSLNVLYPDCSVVCDLDTCCTDCWEE